MSNPHPEAPRVSHDVSVKPMFWSLPKRGADSTHGPIGVAGGLVCAAAGLSAVGFTRRAAGLLAGGARADLPFGAPRICIDPGLCRAAHVTNIPPRPT